MFDFLAAFRPEIKAKGIFLGLRVVHGCVAFGRQAKVSVKKIQQLRAVAAEFFDATLWKMSG